jgi:hypothetical protein
VDSVVRCDKCGREERVGFGASLRSGWPRCMCRGDRYGYTMRLVTTTADIGKATGQAIRSQLPPILR